MDKKDCCISHPTTECLPIHNANIHKKGQTGKTKRGELF